MSTALCQLLYVDCSMSTALCQLLYVDCSMSTALCQLLYVNCSMSSAQCSMSSAQCSMSTAQCSMSTAQCSMSTALFRDLPGHRTLLRTLILSQGKDKPVEKIFVSSGNTRGTELYITYVRVPPECHGGDGLTSLSDLPMFLGCYS